MSPVRQRAYPQERACQQQSATGQLPGVRAYLPPGIQGAALQREGQGAGGGRLPGPHEHAGHPANFRSLLPDAHGSGWGEKIRGLPEFEDTLLPSQDGDVLALDELWSFVEKKTQECWLWLALCRRTRQIVAYTIEDRSQDGTLSLCAHLDEEMRTLFESFRR